MALRVNKCGFETKFLHHKTRAQPEVAKMLIEKRPPGNLAEERRRRRARRGGREEEEEEEDGGKRKENEVGRSIN